MKFVQDLEDTWWRIWFSQVWDSLFPRQNWKEPSNNLQVGDICLKGWNTKLGKGKYVLCRVTDVEVDENGLVRTVTVASRPRDSRDPSLPYRAKELFEERIPVQRLVLICKNENVEE